VPDASKHEEEGALVIADSLQEYIGKQPHIYFEKSLANYAKIRKNGISVLADMGACTHKSMYNELVDYEVSLPTKCERQVRGFCLYHQKDFEKFSDEQKQKLVEHHGKALQLLTK
jgi:hypothetical protein